MKHTPANPAHWWVIEIVDGVYHGACKVCKAKRTFNPDGVDLRAFGREKLQPKKSASVVQAKYR